MIVQLTIAGGYAPKSSRFQIDLSTLDQGSKTELEALVRQARQEPAPGLNQHVHDARSYELVISDEGNNQTIVADDSTLTPTLRKIIQWMKANAARQ
jgi:hypothetical protein